MAGSLARAPSISAAVSAALPSTLCFSSWPAVVVRGREVEVQLQRSGGGRGGREVSVAVHLAAVVMVMGAGRGKQCGCGAHSDCLPPGST